MEGLHPTIYQMVLKVCPVLWITSNYGPSRSSSLCVKVGSETVIQCSVFMKYLLISRVCAGAWRHGDHRSPGRVSTV